jgi:flagellar hook-associated protein 3 FlgL
MRVSTSMMYTLGADAMGRQESDLLHSQQQISSGRRILTPADDPVGAAQAVTVTQAKDRNDQYATNIDTAKSALSLNDTVLSEISDLLTSVRTSAVQGGSSALNDSDRASLASSISSQLQTLLGYANSKDSYGRYMFAGFQTASQPFVDNGSGSIVYNGDQGVKLLQVAPGRSLPVSEPGSNLFLDVKNGNGTVVTAPAGSNSGTGVIGAGQVINPAALNGDSYTIQFHVSGGATTYDVVDSTTSTTISTGNAYTDGAAVNVGGMQFTVSGAPADGDAMTAGPSGQQSIFKTLQNLVATLRAPVATAQDRAKLANGINRALQDIDQAQSNVLTSRTTVGASLWELDQVTSANQGRAQEYAQTLSSIQDLDYNKAISDFSQQQVALDAAQKSFAKISGLSLFNYL